MREPIVGGEETTTVYRKATVSFNILTMNTLQSIAKHEWVAVQYMYQLSGLSVEKNFMELLVCDQM